MIKYGYVDSLSSLPEIAAEKFGLDYQLDTKWMDPFYRFKVEEHLTKEQFWKERSTRKLWQNEKN